MPPQERIQVRVDRETKRLVVQAAHQSGLTQAEIVESIIWETLGPDPQREIDHATVQQLEQHIRVLAEMLALNTHALLARDPRKPDDVSLQKADRLMEKFMAAAHHRSLHESILEAIAQLEYA